MATPPKTFLTPEQYLEIERKAEFKSEYYQGEMFAMGGAKEGHSTEFYDRVRKFEHYRSVESVSEYLLVSVGTREAPSCTPVNPTAVGCSPPSAAWKTRSTCNPWGHTSPSRISTRKSTSQRPPPSLR